MIFIVHLAARLATEEAPAATSLPSAGAAVQVALIGALAPVILVIVNEVMRRWRSKPSGTSHSDGILAPTEEVPRAQFEALLDRIAHMDSELAEAVRRHEADRQRWLGERRELEREVDACRGRCEVEVSKLRDRLITEVERRARAETLWQGRHP